MRHFRDELQKSGTTVLYHELPSDGRKARTGRLASLLGETLAEHSFEKMIVVQTGDHRVRESLGATAVENDITLEEREDRHFYCSVERFADWSKTKPYCASGNYINKMGNHCKGCRYKYNEATGDNACPFTTLYWDFLDRHQADAIAWLRFPLQVGINLCQQVLQRDLSELVVAHHLIKEKLIRLGEVGTESFIEQEDQFEKSNPHILATRPPHPMAPSTDLHRPYRDQCCPR